MERISHMLRGKTFPGPLASRRNRKCEIASHRSRLAELLILCARIGFNP